MSVWVMPSVDVYENFLKRSQAVAGGRRQSQAVGTPIASRRRREPTKPHRQRATIANAIANGMAPTLHKLGHQ